MLQSCQPAKRTPPDDYCGSTKSAALSPKVRESAKGFIIGAASSEWCPLPPLRPLLPAAAANDWCSLPPRPLLPLRPLLLLLRPLRPLLLLLLGGDAPRAVVSLSRR